MTDTIELLKETDAGTKMAVASIDELQDRIESETLKSLLLKCKEDHTIIGNEIHALLREHGAQDKEPTPMAKGMSWMKTNMKMAMDESDATIADLMTDGCNMGIKSLHKYMNQYKAADQTARDLCQKLITREEKLVSDMRGFL